MISIILGILILFIFSHFLCDFAFQSKYMAINKAPIKHNYNWAVIMLAHCFIHAGALFLICDTILVLPLYISLCIFGWELVLHFIIDCSKYNKLFNFNIDQILHILCKIMYTVFIVWVLL